MRAKDLRLLVKNSGAKSVVIDFSGVKFATRSFIDEFYNLFLKNSSTNDFSLEIINVPSDIKTMLDSVSRTQVHATVIPSKSSEKAFKDVNELLQYLCSAIL